MKHGFGNRSAYSAAGSVEHNGNNSMTTRATTTRATNNKSNKSNKLRAGRLFRVGGLFQASALALRCLAL